MIYKISDTLTMFCRVSFSPFSSVFVWNSVPPVFGAQPEHSYLLILYLLLNVFTRLKSSPEGELRVFIKCNITLCQVCCIIPPEKKWLYMILEWIDLSSLQVSSDTQCTTIVLVARVDVRICTRLFKVVGTELVIINIADDITSRRWQWYRQLQVKKIK